MRSFKWIRFVALLLLAAIAVAPAYANGSLAGSAPSRQDATPAATAEAMGGGAMAMFAKGTAIKVGWAGDQSAQLIKPSTGILDGAQLAVNKINAAGGIKGFQVQLVPLDDQCTGDQGGTVAQKFASDPEIVAVVGHVCSGASVIASDTYVKARIPMVSASNTAVIVTARGLDVVNSVAFSDKNQGLADVLYMINELKAKKLAVLDDAQTYGQGLANAVKEDFQALGGEVTDAESIDKDAKDYRPVLTKMLANPPDVLFFGGYEGPAALLTSQMKEVGLTNTIFFSDDGAYTTDYIKLAGTASESAYASSAQQAGGDEAALKAFQAEFEKTFNVQYHDYDPYQPAGYDSAMLILNALNQVATVDASGNLTIDRDALVKAVRATKDYKGLTGTITCDSTGACGSGSISVNQVKDAAWVNGLKIYTAADLAAAMPGAAATAAPTMAATAGQ